MIVAHAKITSLFFSASIVLPLVIAHLDVHGKINIIIAAFFALPKVTMIVTAALQNRTLISMLAATAWPLLITRLEPIQFPIQRIRNNVLYT